MDSLRGLSEGVGPASPRIPYLSITLLAKEHVRGNRFGIRKFLPRLAGLWHSSAGLRLPSTRQPTGQRGQGRVTKAPRIKKKGNRRSKTSSMDSHLEGQMAAIISGRTENSFLLTAAKKKLAAVFMNGFSGHSNDSPLLPASVARSRPPPLKRRH